MRLSQEMRLKRKRIQKSYLRRFPFSRQIALLPLFGIEIVTVVVRGLSLADHAFNKQDRQMYFSRAKRPSYKPLFVNADYEKFTAM